MSLAVYLLVFLTAPCMRHVIDQSTHLSYCVCIFFFMECTSDFLPFYLVTQVPKLHSQTVSICLICLCHLSNWLLVTLASSSSSHLATSCQLICLPVALSNQIYTHPPTCLTVLSYFIPTYVCAILTNQPTNQPTYLTTFLPTYLPSSLPTYPNS